MVIWAIFDFESKRAQKRLRTKLKAILLWYSSVGRAFDFDAKASQIEPIGHVFSYDESEKVDRSGFRKMTKEVDLSRMGGFLANLSLNSLYSLILSVVF